MTHLAKGVFQRPPNRLLQYARELAPQEPSELSGAALQPTAPSHSRRGLLGVYDDMRKEAAWKNVPPAPGLDPTVEKIDCDGRRIRWVDYAQHTKFGWEVDHTLAKALGGSDDFQNLRARHWFGNRQAGGLLAALMQD